MNVRPRHAASLVLVKKEARGHSVLMGKRAKQHKFLPNVYVFPGGRVDAEDQKAQVSKPLSEPVAKKLAYPNEHLSHAIAVAAARETWEETGLIIGDIKDGNLVADLSGFDYVARAITPPNNPIRFHTRFLVANADHAKGELAGSGELLDLHWVRIEDAFKLTLIDVTEFVLEEIQHYLKEDQPRHMAIPLFGYRNGRPHIRRK